jgi:hypothetical protein
VHTVREVEERKTKRWMDKRKPKRSGSERNKIRTLDGKRRIFVGIWTLLVTFVNLYIHTFMETACEVVIIFFLKLNIITLDQ